MSNTGKKKNRKKQPYGWRQDLKNDFATFQTLSGKNRLQFIWDYYKWKILACIVALTVIIIFANILWQGQRPCWLRVCVVLNTEDDCSPWFEQFEKDMNKDKNEGYLDVNQDQPFDYDNQYFYIQEAEVMTTVSSQRMDVAVCNADMYEYLLALNACMPLDEVLPDEVLSEVTERGILDHNTANLQEDKDGNINPEDGIDGYFALNLEGTEFAAQYNDSEEPLYAVIISNTRYTEDAVALLAALAQ